jgi:hypothetical protein
MIKDYQKIAQISGYHEKFIQSTTNAMRHLKKKKKAANAAMC